MEGQDQRRKPGLSTRAMENSINRFDVYNSTFLEFRFLYYLMSWLAADQFLLDDIVRVICDAEEKKP